MSDETYRPGNAEDFDRLYRTSYARVLRTLVGIVGDVAAAEDCAQDAFTRAYQAWGRWKPDAPAEAWLHRIAVRVAITHLRQSKRRSLPQLLIRLGRPSPGPELADAVTGSAALLAALGKLSPEQAAAIILRHHHGYSNREIAIAIGVPESTVSTRLGVAREKLAALLGRPASVRPRLARPEPVNSVSEDVV